MFKIPYLGYAGVFTELMALAMQNFTALKTPIRTGPGRKTLDTYHKKIDPKTYREAEFDDRPAEHVSRQALRQEQRAQDAAVKADDRKEQRSFNRHAMLNRQRTRELNGFYTGPAVGTMLGKERPVATLSRAKFR